MNAQLTNLLNKYVFTEHVFGLNDCNIILADYLDSLLGTEYLNQLKGQYENIEQGLLIAKKAGLNSPKYILEKHATKVDTAKDGDVLITKVGKYWAVSIVFKNQMITEYDNKYIMMPISLTDKTLIYRIGE
ncbi:DUF6950 family protein [Serratia marcescens]|uniref:DUF6950 family protein n=1 Tax=Serratia marcescens TaxID=615 RepID=UPI001F14E749|nr:hypothetical protein [Serratia marcescens]MDP8728368.1 hypothetical protein [Serratia marcescens]